MKAIKKETHIKAIEIHAHDDFGNAVENTMAAVRAAVGRLGQNLPEHHLPGHRRTRRKR